MSEQLKPCPFCGCKGVCVCAYDSDLGTIWRAHCQDCTCSVQGESKEEVTKLWNTRTEMK